MSPSSVLSGAVRPISWTFSQAYHHPTLTTALVAGFASSYLLQCSFQTAAYIGAVSFVSSYIGMARENRQVYLQLIPRYCQMLCFKPVSPPLKFS